ncbi:hypothetical protein CDL15_Pgr020775 [Punica granatum]|uniref:Uncharacterized protein n=1 Tax=Punica granatum TaxID=22663 RepID=A0A218XWD0_PUNGR|nr:hypothetical protein CDL15_Pgr020775 [Punica granatum]
MHLPSGLLSSSPSLGNGAQRFIKPPILRRGLLSPSHGNGVKGLPFRAVFVGLACVSTLDIFVFGQRRH